MVLQPLSCSLSLLHSRRPRAARAARLTAVLDATRMSTHIISRANITGGRMSFRDVWIFRIDTHAIPVVMR